MRDHDRRRALQQQLFERRDAVDVEMIGRLVEQQQVGLQARARERAPRACARRRTRVCGAALRVEAEAMQEFHEPRFDAPALALVVQCARCAPRAIRLSRSVAAGGSSGSCSTSTTRKPSCRASSPSSSASVPAIACSSEDLPVPLRPIRPMRSPSLDRQVGAVEQRMQAVGELGVAEGEQGHGCGVGREG